MNSTHAACNRSLLVADLSAIRRDLLWILVQTGPCESHPLHHALSDYYTESIAHSRVCDTLEELIEDNFVSSDTANRYHLTEPGRRALSARQAWQADTTSTKGGSK